MVREDQARPGRRRWRRCVGGGGCDVQGGPLRRGPEDLGAHCRRREGHVRPSPRLGTVREGSLMTCTAGMHHVRNGLYFKRLDDGSVLLVKKDGADGPLVFEAAIDKDAWCSVVA